MGASHSKQDNEQVFYNQVPIQVKKAHPTTPRTSMNLTTNQTHPQVSEELATQLSDTSLSPEVSPTRQTILDQNVRAKIHAEAARLRGHGDGKNASEGEGEGVDIVQREIEAALERENLDRERGMAGDADTEAEGGVAHGDIKNSTALLGDLEEVRQKVERYRERASLTDHLGVKEAREAVASCYQYVLLSLSL
jgi:MICOS complex subunit MIC19